MNATNEFARKDQPIFMTLLDIWRWINVVKEVIHFALKAKNTFERIAFDNAKSSIIINVFYIFFLYYITIFVNLIYSATPIKRPI